ncbi:hypothetical protein E5676_scaffold113G001370 [Cucumis melo var. makuwa]|uniref:Uncharacterized protein n=1 Tax=Cucumis melo var. makuwa TaxID=1194695 RepID=A0A5A7U981_CUCMM|nr:hypothetical protein E6C27_scaffold207G001480 [Cucumis melo var. makuwa]TYK01875.1 hypothetical protein E5676_scaffold113G001370 [Cucumis melo var. makuwa]
MWVLPTHKYVGENAKYVGKGYPDVQNGVGKNVGRNASREAFPAPIWYGVGKGFPDARRGFPDAVTWRREIPQNASGKGEFPTLIKPLFPTFHAASGKTPIPDASSDALFTTSGKGVFLDVFLPTPSWCVGKDGFPDAAPDALLRASGKPLFPTFFMPT